MVIKKSDITKVTIALLMLFVSNAGSANMIVSIEGNASFSSRKLKTIFNRGFSDGKLFADNLEQGIYLLKSFYRRSGYVNSEIEYIVDSSRSETAEIKLVITEGDRYYTDEIIFEGNKGLAPGILSQALVNKVKKPFNAEDLGQDDFNLMLLYADHGYIYAESEHSLEYRNGHKAVIRYTIKEGPKVNVSHIEFKGLHYIKDKFIINALSFSAGDVFSRRELIKSHYLLQSSGLFANVDIAPGGIDSNGNAIAVSVNVNEKPRRLFETSIGYGSGDALRVMAKWAHRNLFGMGRKLEYDGLVSFRTKLPLDLVRGRSQLSYDDPYFSFLKTPARGEVFYDDFRPSYTDYRLETVGFNLSLSMPLANSINIDYRWKQEWLKLSPNWQISKYKADTLSYKGRRSLSVITSFDKLDDPIHPQSGLSGYLELEYTGGIMGGAETFQRAVNNWTYYFKIPSRRLSFANRLRYGIVGDWSRESVIPKYEMFFLGGASTVRGYSQGAIGPVDNGGMVTGGRILLLINLQTMFYLGRNWSLAGFLDGGMLSNRSFRKQSLGEMVSSPGLGVRYSLPFGTGRFDLAAPGTLLGQIKYWRWMLAWGEPF